MHVKKQEKVGVGKCANIKMTMSLSVDGRRQKEGSPCLCLVGGAAALHACSARADALKSAILPACPLMVIQSLGQLPHGLSHIGDWEIST